MGHSHSRCYAVEVFNPGGSLWYMVMADEEEKNTEEVFPSAQSGQAEGLITGWFSPTPSILYIEQEAVGPHHVKNLTGCGKTISA